MKVEYSRRIKESETIYTDIITRYPSINDGKKAKHHGNKNIMETVNSKLARFAAKTQSMCSEEVFPELTKFTMKLIKFLIKQ